MKRNLYLRNPEDDSDLPPCFQCGGDAVREWMGMHKLTIVCAECGASACSSAGPVATEKLWREEVEKRLKGLRT